MGSCTSQEQIKTIAPKDLKVLLAKKNVQILDVRTPEEIAQGTLKNAKFANYFDVNFTENASTKLNKSKPVYILCRSGNRSLKACKILKEKGFDVINISGGINQWKKEN